MPPLISAKMATLTASAAPKEREMYSNLVTSGAALPLLKRRTDGETDSDAICVPAKAMKRNINVPTNSPAKTVSSVRRLLVFLEGPVRGGRAVRSGEDGRTTSMNLSMVRVMKMI